MIKTVTTIDGVNAVNFGNTTSRYYWCKNIGDSYVHVSTVPTCTADSDDVAILPAGETVLLENYGNEIYVLGKGKIEVHAQDLPYCPFKVVKKGGESGDNVIITDYACFFGNVVSANIGTIETI